MIRWSTPVLSFILATVAAAPSGAQTVDDVERLRDRTSPASTHLTRYLGREIQTRTSREKYRDALATEEISVSERIAALEGLSVEYERRRRKDDLSVSTLQDLDALTKSLVTGSLELIPGPAGTVLSNGAGYIAETQLRRLEERFEARLRDDTRAVLKTRLDEYASTAGEGEYRALLATRDPDKVIKAMELRLGPVFSDALRDVPAADRDVVLTLYTQEVAKVTRDGIAVLAGVQSLQGQQLEDTQRNVAALSATFVQFADVTNARLTRVIEVQEELKSGLSEISSRLGTTEAGVDFLQRAVFSKMSPVEKRHALEAGIFPGMPAQERERLEKEVALVAKQQELAREITSYINGAADLVTIARNLGVDQGLVNAAQTAVTAGSAVFRAHEAFAASNIIGGMTALSGLFGLGGPDVASQRHQQVMSALKGIAEGVQVVDQKVNALLDGQKSIMQAQKATFEAIQALSDQVTANQTALMEQLHEIQRDVQVNRDLIVAAVSADYTQCHILKAHPVTLMPRISTSAKVYPTARQLAQILIDHPGAYRACTDRFARVQFADGRILPHFHLKSFAAEENTVAQYTTRVYEPSRRLLFDDVMSAQEREEVVAQLFAPAATVRGVDEKTVRKHVQHEARFGESAKVPLASHLAEALSPDMVAQHAEDVLDLHFLAELIGPDGQVVPFSSLVGDTPVSRAGYFYLYSALTLVDVAVAQQALVGGDLLLPALYRVVTSGDTSTGGALRRDYAVGLLADNAILAANFLRYALGRAVADQGAILTYGAALSVRDPRLIHAVVGLPLDLSWADEDIKRADGRTQKRGWSARFRDSYVPLPSAMEVDQGRLMMTPDLQRLLTLRLRLTEEIANYDVLEVLPRLRRTIANELLLGS